MYFGSEDAKRICDQARKMVGEEWSGSDLEKLITTYPGDGSHLKVGLDLIIQDGSAHLSVQMIMFLVTVCTLF